VVKSAYDPVFRERSERSGEDDLTAAKKPFAAASRPYLTSPIPWFAWAIVLPGAALTTSGAALAGGPAAVLGLWSGAILVGGAIEAFFLFRSRRRHAGSPLGSWAMTLQGNLSLVAVALSAALYFVGARDLLPGLWLLLLGHSLFALGGLAFRPQRTAGILYQLGGVAALLPGAPELELFAAVTALGNLWIGIGVARRPSAT
jgi:hypothetical protein